MSVWVLQNFEMQYGLSVEAACRKLRGVLSTLREAGAAEATDRRRAVRGRRTSILGGVIEMAADGV